MREAGYSRHTASKPSNLTQSKGWGELLEAYFPDTVLASLHRDVLNASKLEYIKFPSIMTDSEIKGVLANIDHHSVISLERMRDVVTACIKVPDHKAQFKALELVYKLKGRIKNKGIKPDILTY